MPNDLEKKETLLKIIREAEALDTELRQQFQIGEKFRFIRDRLHAVVKRVEESVASLKEEVELGDKPLTENETLVYIYLFNAQGLVLQSWLKMLNPAVFYEYSVNRPIYQEKKFVDAIIRNKQNKVQHGYITICIKKDDIVAVNDVKDTNGNPTIRVREGSFRADKFISFTHNFIEYKLVDNQLVKK